MIDTAVIMAAGKGTRFGSRTVDMPKGFIDFKGKSMIERSIENLLEVGIKRIIIGTGYHREWYEKLKQKYPCIETVFSTLFEESNSMETLYQCRNVIGKSDFLLLESDIIYEAKALSLLLKDSHEDIMLISEVTKFQDQYYIAVDSNKFLLKCSTDEKVLEDRYGVKPYGELIGIHKISNKFYTAMIEDYGSHRKEYIKRGYEYEIQDISSSGNDVFDNESKEVGSPCVIKNITSLPMYVLKAEKIKWYEIDDEDDLKYAERFIDIG